ncbi:MAG: excisionase family DNA-binding protein [Candidatus Aminicenantales bacterium]|jgi:excisionase family DNA binding protein
MTPAIPRRWISVNEAGVYLGVHPMTVRTWIDQGKLDAVRLGRTLRIDFQRLELKLEAMAGAAVRPRRPHKVSTTRLSKSADDGGIHGREAAVAAGNHDVRPT